MSLAFTWEHVFFWMACPSNTFFRQDRIKQIPEEHQTYHVWHTSGFASRLGGQTNLVLYNEPNRMDKSETFRAHDLVGNHLTLGLAPQRVLHSWHDCNKYASLHKYLINIHVLFHTTSTFVYQLEWFKLMRPYRLGHGVTKSTMLLAEIPFLSVSI